MRIHPTATVHPGAKLGEGVEVGPGAVIDEHVQIGDGTSIGPHVHVTGWTNIGRECRLFTCATLGAEPQDLGFTAVRSYLRVGDRNVCREHTVMHRGTKEDSETVIGDDNYFMNYSHVGHNVRIGNHVTLANSAQVSGFVEIDDRTFVSGCVVIHQYCRIGRLVMVSGLSAINQDIPPFVTCGGRPCAATGLNSVGLQRAQLSAEVCELLKKAFRLLYRSGLDIKEARQRIEAEVEPCAEIEELLRFIRESKRGIIFDQESVKKRGRDTI